MRSLGGKPALSLLLSISEHTLCCGCEIHNILLWRWVEGAGGGDKRVLDYYIFVEVGMFVLACRSISGGIRHRWVVPRTSRIYEKQTHFDKLNCCTGIEHESAFSLEVFINWLVLSSEWSFLKKKKRGGGEVGNTAPCRLSGEHWLLFIVLYLDNSYSENLSWLLPYLNYDSWWWLLARTAFKWQQLWKKTYCLRAAALYTSAFTA